MNHDNPHRPALAAHLAFPACIAVLTLGLSACASGGGGGRVPLDSGTASRDSSTSDGMIVPRPDSSVDSGRPDTSIRLMDSGAPDTGALDSGPADTGPAPECTLDSDCSDGLACTGTETCVGGRCVAGSAVSCDDSVACTRDSCGEPGGACSSTADDSLCAPSERCDPSAGCVPSSSCSESPCRLVAPQCGCGASEGCYLSSSGTHVCAAAGTTAVGARCDRAQCVPGAICVNIAATGPSVPICRAACASDTDCSGTGALCIGGVTGSSDKTCSVGCDPATQTGCPSGTACSFFTETAGAMRRLTDCSAPVGTGGQNASCADDTDCQKGFGCFTTPAGVKQCLHWCRKLPPGGECSGGTTCLGFTTAIIWNGTEYGVCD